ncbi:MAG: serine--tRNA ligase [Clostridia bacterium]|nr:serine--tRNA ligase [Clostridia bacterium]MBQ4624737.1 serine--tRNA ligase [Clostridia bacterium]MBR6762758.1 serine--tRNA ligase [Clostridia bacterium]
MLDIKLIKENPEEIKARLRAKEVNMDAEIDRILELDLLRRENIKKTEALKAEQNKVTKSIPAMKKAGQDTTEIFAQMKALSEEIKVNDAKLKEIEEEYRNYMLALPNLPDTDLLPGGKENNQPLRYFGEPHKFDFEPKNHVDLCNDLGLIDYERGTKLGGNGFWIYKGMGARLEWALLNYFIDTHIADGYEFILPPHMLEYQCGVTAGQFPKFADEVYKIANPTAEGRIHYMLPTAEAALASYFRDEILKESDLPQKMFAYTPCFRREAGSYRSDERGMVRGHQFNKVEMFQFTTPEGSDEAFEELVVKAEKLVSGLGFHFRTVKLAAGDCSASMARTYDIEIQIPSMNGYKEVSSVSNARDYQARRGNIRFKREATGKPEFVHTLNGSGLATSRILPALVEQNQLPDGSVKVPEVLQKYLGGLEVISK